ncbi:hypothetical protein [Maricaulis sp.]|uniref:hypothetical protein n=1 Tax=Maricaulis sp. TaxID=1486257 RepID=UPI003A8E342E
MDWSSVVLAAIGGAVGAGLGTLLLAVLWPRRATADGAARKLDLRGIVMIIVVVLGARLGQPLLDPVIGPTVRDWIGPDFEGDVAEMMAQEPFFQVLQEKAPERAQAWRDAVAAAYREGGGVAAERVARTEGEAIGAWVMAEFSPRATDEALLDFYSALGRVTRETLLDHPRDCYGFYFPGVPGGPPSPDLEALGVDPLVLARQMIELARTANDEAVPVNSEAGQAGVAAAVAAASEAIGAENMVLFGARLPENDAEFALICRGMLVYLDHISTSDDAANTFRALASAG